ncbi:MAG: hypothetical protein VBE63_15005 [Lamprobacter sp.]|uniref:hypothetical protein n=1 Tax=Lamprobacter sp. TaxID=3100796 RepID=UPI002B25ECF3|nr:hypothetical protein [Lamprobacter sp.]MEA3641231.1 hypothetical protein [Lamprobacter sp.]
MAWSYASIELALRLTATATALLVVGWPVSRLQPVRARDSDIQTLKLGDEVILDHQPAAAAEARATL